MVPIRIGRKEVNEKKLIETILQTCEKHKEQGRALVFSFLLYDFHSPEISRILEDDLYLNSFNDIAGTDISVFYFFYDQKLIRKNAQTIRKLKGFGMHGKDLRHGVQSHFIRVPSIGNPKLDSDLIQKNLLGIESEVDTPAIIFFQVKDKQIIDLFIVELEAGNVESTFNEIREILIHGKATLKKIDPKNYSNSEEIFKLLKEDIKARKLKSYFSKKAVELLPFLNFILKPVKF